MDQAVLGGIGDRRPAELARTSHGNWPTTPVGDTSDANAAAAIWFRSRRAFLRSSHDTVRRSVVALIEDRKPNSASTAPNTHHARLNAPAPSSNAPRPTTFRIGRVWLPWASASRAARATSFGP